MFELRPVSGGYRFQFRADNGVLLFVSDTVYRDLTDAMRGVKDATRAVAASWGGNATGTPRCRVVPL